MKKKKKRGKVKSNRFLKLSFSHLNPFLSVKENIYLNTNEFVEYTNRLLSEFLMSLGVYKKVST